MNGRLPFSFCRFTVRTPLNGETANDFGNVFFTSTVFGVGKVSCLERSPHFRSVPIDGLQSNDRALLQANTGGCASGFKYIFIWEAPSTVVYMHGICKGTHLQELLHECSNLE